MNSRQRTLVALNHREPDLVPVCLAYETPRSIAARYGKTYDPGLMRQDIHTIGLDLGEPAQEIKERYLRGIQEDSHVDSWGVATWRKALHAIILTGAPFREPCLRAMAACFATGLRQSRTRKVFRTSRAE